MPVALRSLGHVHVSIIYNTDPLKSHRMTSSKLVVNTSSSGPVVGVLGKAPPTEFHICSRKCLLVSGYCIAITQLLLVSQPETLISEYADFHIIKIASTDITVSGCLCQVELSNFIVIS